jgi:hypothetical protein
VVAIWLILFFLFVLVLALASLLALALLDDRIASSPPVLPIVQ